MKSKQFLLSSEKGTLAIALEWKNVKKLRLRIRNEGATCSCPHFMSEEEVGNFLLAHREWILKTLRKAERLRADSYLYREEGKIFLWGEEYRLIHEKGNPKVEVTEGKIFLRSEEGDLSPFYRYARTLLEEKCREMEEPLLKLLACKGYHRKPALRFRKMKSRWGSCAVIGNTVCLNLLLIHFPPECLRYVLWHEYSHFIHANHSPSFWATVAELIPDYRRIEKIMH